MSPWNRLDQFLTRKRIFYAWIAGGAFYLAWLTSVLLGPGNMDLANQVVGTDYVQFYAAGRTLVERGEAYIYDFNVQREIEEAVAGQELEGFHAFITPPFVAWLFAPLAILPYGWSYAAFCLSMLLLLWLSLKLLDNNIRRISLIWALSWFPVFANFSFGQNGILSLFILCLTYALWMKGKHFYSGVVFSLMLYKPQLVTGVMLLWLLDYRRSWRSLVGFIVGSISLAGISYVFMPQATQDYLFVVQKILPTIDDWESFPHWHSYTLRTFLFLLSRNASISTLTAMLISIFPVMFFIKLRRSERDNITLLYSAAICLTVVTAPHALVYDWTILLLPAIIFWFQYPRLRIYWKSIFSMVWVTTYVSSILTIAQLKLFPIAIQISVPVLFMVLYYTCRIFLKGETEQLLSRATE